MVRPALMLRGCCQRDHAQRVLGGGRSDTTNSIAGSLSLSSMTLCMARVTCVQHCCLTYFACPQHDSAPMPMLLFTPTLGPNFAQGLGQTWATEALDTLCVTSCTSPVERVVPCYRRASAVTGAAEQAEAIVAGEGGDEEDWVAPERTGGAAPSTDGNQDDGIPTLGEDAPGRADVRCAIRVRNCALALMSGEQTRHQCYNVPVKCRILDCSVMSVRRATTMRIRCRTSMTSTLAMRRRTRCLPVLQVPRWFCRLLLELQGMKFLSLSPQLTERPVESLDEGMSLAQSPTLATTFCRDMTTGGPAEQQHEVGHRAGQHPADADVRHHDHVRQVPRGPDDLAARLRRGQAAPQARPGELEAGVRR